MTATPSERRRFFRIDDHVRLKYKVVTDLRHLPGHRDDAIGRPRQVLLKDLERDFNSSLNALWQQDPLIAKALAQLNRKLDLLNVGEEAGGVAGTSLIAEPTQVNISACGIAFKVDENLPAGRLLDMNIALLPSEINLRLTARVVGVDALAEPGATEQCSYLLRAEFAGNDADAQETLISHIVQRQLVLMSEAE